MTAAGRVAGMGSMRSREGGSKTPYYTILKSTEALRGVVKFIQNG